PLTTVADWCRMTRTVRMRPKMLSSCCTLSPENGSRPENSPSWTRQMYSRNSASHWWKSPVNFTACRWLSCSICRSASRTSAASRAPGDARALNPKDGAHPEGGTPSPRHPQGRKLIFVGDLVDRGPKIAQVLELVMNAVSSGAALCVPGNHDIKLMRKLRGRDV